SAPGQHTPAAPAAMQPKPLGQPPPPFGSQDSTQNMLPLPSLPHWPDAHSELPVHGVPRPPGASLPGTQRLSTQVSVDCGQSLGLSHSLPIVTVTDCAAMRPLML